MRVLLIALALLLAVTAEARPARPRAPGGDVHMTISLRERIMVAAILQGSNPMAKSWGEVQGMISLDQALDLAAAREFAKAHPKNPIGDASDDQKPVALTREEASALIAVVDFQPTNKKPIDFAEGRILLGIKDAANEALSKASGVAPMAVKGPPKK